ncbi:retron Ec48 family effector membrane protein, partial [Pseudomonas fragi]|nr:retron Ec48 family effector membrane protein [Pseudomonas fragi]
MINLYKIIASVGQNARIFFTGQHPYFKYLIILLSSIGGIGFSLFLVVFVVIFFADQLYLLPICFSNKCFINSYENYSSAFNIAKSTLDLIVLTATVGAIFVALLSYLSTLKSSCFTNHISHLTLFQDFFTEEVRKRGRPRKLSATPDLSGTVLPLCPIPNSALKSARSFSSVKLKASP